MYSVIVGDQEAHVCGDSVQWGCADGFASDGDCEWSESDICNAVVVGASRQGPMTCSAQHCSHRPIT